MIRFILESVETYIMLTTLKCHCTWQNGRK